MKGFIGVTLFAIVAAATAENLCPPEQATQWDTIELLLPHSKCNKFYKCTYGEPVPQDCPAGLYYNVESQQCDWPNLVDCGDRIDPAAPAPVVPVESDESTDDSVEGSTEAGGSGDGENENVGDSSEEKDDNAETDGDNAETDGDNAETDGDNAETDGENSEAEGDNESAEGDGGNVEIDFLPNGCPVKPHVHWLLPNKVDCNAFYYCVWGEKVPRKCSQALDFNPVLQVCDWPANAGCAKSFSKHAEQRRYFIDRM